ncbi:MAG: type II toxin-antitoxin system Phd/YefM family antitoxin [Parcubacteria group bacterium]
MNGRTTVPISEARKKIFDIADAVQKPSIHYTLTEQGRPKAVIMSVDEYESWVETLEILSDPDAMKAIAKSEKEFDRGEYVTLDELKKELVFDTEDMAHNLKKSRKKATKKAKKRIRGK